MAQQCLVRDLMLIPRTQPVSLSCTLRKAAELLLCSDSDLLPVVTDEGRLAGIITESSVIRLLMTNPSTDVTIESIVSRHVESVLDDAPISSVKHLFRSDCHSAIPVVTHDGKVRGLLIRRHVMNVLLDGQVPVRIEHDSHSITNSSPPTPPTLTVTPADSAAPGNSESPHGSAPPANSKSPSESSTPSMTEPPRPHFLRGAEARRRLSLFDERENL
ncbi:MAG: CBS domain-containing protein [Planctomyces sp.]|nr:CBS domain-containing protein [Planctomyces sp.]